MLLALIVQNEYSSEASRLILKQAMKELLCAIRKKWATYKSKALFHRRGCLLAPCRTPWPDYPLPSSLHSACVALPHLTIKHDHIIQLLQEQNCSRTLPHFPQTKLPITSARSTALGESFSSCEGASQKSGSYRNTTIGILYKCILLILTICEAALF